MNYYDALLQHRQQIADAERHHANARLLRDIKDTPKEQADEKEERRTAPFTRLARDLKAALDSFRWSEQDAVILSEICE
jgi:hypothetical protein